MRKFSKITPVRFNNHINLTIEGKSIDVTKEVARSIEYSLSTHNEMVERIEYLESVAAQVINGQKPVTTVSKVKYYSQCYSGSGFNVIAGHGEVPSEFIAVSESGVKIKARKSMSMCGGGHGEGSAYPVETYDVAKINGGWDWPKEEIYTITDVIKQ